MSEIVTLQKTIYSNNINNVIDTSFSQLIPPSETQIPAVPDTTVDQFFEQYNILFYEIPPSGSDNSHLGLANRSLEYLGLSLDDLQIEIEYLRQENVELKNQIFQASKINPGELQEL
jgi:hypothetical protein